MANKTRVLIVDDSALMREALKSIIEQDPDIEIVGLAKNGKEGVEKALMLKPEDGSTCFIPPRVRTRKVI